MSQTPTLRNLYTEHAGFVSDKWSLYLSEYERLFAPFRDVPINLLEIGVQNGGSLEIWGKYFPKAQRILGCDINSACAQLSYENKAIKVVVGDINSTATIDTIFNDTPVYDIIIDDGSHTSSDIIQTFCRFFPHLKQDGIFVAEDLHCSYWRQYDGGLYHPRSSMAFFKTLADVLNFEHWGIDHSRERLLQPFGITSELNDTLLAELHSVEFVNSMCILTKRPPDQNVLGKRCVVGLQEVVAPVKRVNGSLCQTPPQQFKAADLPAPTLSAGLASIAAALELRLKFQEQTLAEQSERIAELEQTRQQMGEHLLRAEGQLELLKSLLGNGT